MGFNTSDLLSQIFGKKEEPKQTAPIQAQPTQQSPAGFNFTMPTGPTPAVQNPNPMQFDFSQFVEQPSDDSYLNNDTEEQEELDEYVDTAGQPKNAFNLNLGALGFNTPQAQPQQIQVTAGDPFSLSSVVKSPAASGYVSPYEGKRGKHPNNCDCSIHKGSGTTPENVAAAFPSTLQNQESQKSSTGFNPSAIPQTQPQRDSVNIEVNKKTLWLIGEGLETVGRAIKSLAENS